jgi:glutathione S-transferase
MRARMALYYAGQNCEVREVDLKAKPSTMIDLSAKGTVPVLATGDQVLDESLDIMRWCLDQHDPDGWLDCDGQEPLVAQLLGDNDGWFKEHLDGYKYAGREAAADALAHRQQAEVFITRLESLLSAKPSQRFLLGDKLSFVDVAVMPFVRQFANVDMRWFESTEYEALQRWLADLTGSPLFAAVMVKRKPWQEGQPPVQLF